MIAEAQRQGGNVAFIDAEHALDTAYARRLGVDVDNLLISQPDFGEQALEIAEILIRSGGIDVVVIDSVAALVPRAEIDGNVGDQHVGLQARLMSHAMRKFTGVLSRTNTVLIFIRPDPHEDQGVMFGPAGPPPAATRSNFTVPSVSTSARPPRSRKARM